MDMKMLGGAKSNSKPETWQVLYTHFLTDVYSGCHYKLSY